MNFKKIAKTIAVVSVILVVATFFDYLAHSTSPRFGVPPEYFTNKVIYGSLIGLLALLVFRKTAYMIAGALLYAVLITSVSAQIGIRLPLPEGGTALVLALAVRFLVLLGGVSAFTALMYWIANHFQKPTKMAILFSYAIALGLQTKYFFLGFDLFFVFLFMFLHFVMFLLPAVVLFRKYPEVVE